MEGQMEEQQPRTTTAGADPTKALDQALALLRSRNDTDKFVGLALLKSILDSQQALLEDPVVITKCWSAISPRFLDALLRASGNEGRSKEEARSMVELAVAIIHTFTVLLPSDSQSSERIVGRAPALVAALLRSSSDTTRQILQILLTYSSNINGARALLKLDLEEISPLLEISLQEPSVLDIIRHAFMNAVRGDDSSKDSANSRLDGIISALIRSFRNADPTNLFDFLESLVTELPSSMLYPAPWLLSLISMIHQTLTRAQTDAVDTIRTSAVALAATLLSLYKDKAAVLLFSSSGNQPSSSSGKPTVYLLIKLVIVDIHATIPALEDSRISPGFNNTFKRLAASYDVVVSFIGYLFRLLDEEDTADLPLSSDLILRLRSDIAESISITIEFIKDHFDRVHGKQGAFKSTLLLPPPASGHVLQQDPELDLLAAQVRLLAIWLREDDNEKLRTEAIHIIPVLLQLYTPSSSADSAHDVRFPVLGALQGIVSQPEGAESFFENGGWEVLSGDFLPILELVFRSQRENPEEQDRVRALEVIRVLLAAIESQSSSVAQFRDDWLTLLPLSLASDKSTRQITSGELELLIAAWQLAVEILSRAPCPARAESSDEAKRMAQLAKGYLTMPDLDEGNKEGLQEVLAGLAEVFPRL